MGATKTNKHRTTETKTKIAKNKGTKTKKRPTVGYKKKTYIFFFFGKRYTPASALSDTHSLLLPYCSVSKFTIYGSHKVERQHKATTHLGVD